MSVGELEALTRRVAANLRRLGFAPGDAIAIIMPMTAECVAIYLGIIAAGCAVVGIADSFRPKEIATRLRIAECEGDLHAGRRDARRKEAAALFAS